MVIDRCDTLCIVRQSHCHEEFQRHLLFLDHSIWQLDPLSEFSEADHLSPCIFRVVLAFRQMIKGDVSALFRAM